MLKTEKVKKEAAREVDEKVAKEEQQMEEIVKG